MAEHAAEIAQLLLREGALRDADPEHREIREELLGHAELFEDVRRRLASVGFRLVERLGHVGVAVDPDAAQLAASRNRMGLHAGHLRLIVYLWTHLVYREWNDLRRDRKTAPPGAEQGGLAGVLPDVEDEPPWIALSHVRAEWAEVTSVTHFKGLLRALRRWRFVRYDNKRDRLWADASLYTLVDLVRMEDFVVNLARRLGTEQPADAVTAVVTGSAVAQSTDDDEGDEVIRLDRVELLHWDIQPHQVLPLATGVTLCTGENGSGKTSLLDAIKVGLGANRLGGDRTIDGYLLRQAQPVAMIRIVVDNRPAPGTRRRPFDPLGEHAADLVTLAVVMRQDEESHYTREYFVLDGDEVPVDALDRARSRRRGSARPLSLTDFRKRLRKVGIGREYLKLLCLPQGQIASFCHHDGPALFDDLYDIIGGREALETWEERVRELTERQREHGAVQAELRGRQRELDVLEERVHRHQDFQRTRDVLARHRAALPHLRIAEARDRVEQLKRDERALADILAAVERRLEAARAARQIAQDRVGAAEETLEQVRREQAEAQQARDDAVRAHAAKEARRRELDRLRLAAAGVPVVEPALLEREQEELRTALARGEAQQSDRSDRAGEIDAELERLSRGLLPFPAEVDAFRDRLRRAGIMHHVLAEVLEVEDERWTPALEGYLGRRRFAVLVQDPDRWAEAARLARQARYPHGVLAPDVRGRSPADDEGLTPLVDVGEARYRSLVARLLRRVVPGEPPEPLEPPRRQELLAEDGFLVTRLEARHAGEDRHFLGRRALERRRAQLESMRAALEAESAAWRQQAARLRGEVQRAQAELEAQRRRLAWEAARVEHAELVAAEAELAERVKTLEARAEALERRRKALEDERAGQQRALGEADSDARAAHQEREHLGGRIDQLGARRRQAERALGELLAAPPPAPDAGVQAVLDEGHGLDTVEAMVAREEAQLEAFEPAVRDELLPINYARQRDEVAAVEQRLARLAEILDGTRSAAQAAHEQYRETTRRVFRGYFARLRGSAGALDWTVDGRLVPREDGRFACAVKVAVGAKQPVSHDSEQLSGGQKAALSILMGMTAVSLERDGAAFFLIDEPFSASDVHKINELGEFLRQTGAQYLLSMPTSADLQRCGDWLQAVWTCTRSRGGFDAHGRPLLAPPVKLGFATAAQGEGGRG